jgi:hypothetical protein
MAAGSTYTPIATTTLGSAASSVTFSSISGSYTDLILIESFQFASTGSQSRMSFGDTSTLYSVTTLRGDGSAANSARFTAQPVIANTPGNTNSTANLQVNGIRHIMNYSNTTTYKTVIQRSNDASEQLVQSVGLWSNTAAISTIVLASLSGNYAVGSTFTLYGIAAA